jgi:hypothetical protein
MSKRNCCATGRKGTSLSSTKRQADGLGSRKYLLAEVLTAGRDARIVGLPLEAAQVLRFMCVDLVIPKNVADQHALWMSSNRGHRCSSRGCNSIK